MRKESPLLHVALGGIGGALAVLLLLTLLPGSFTRETVTERSTVLLNGSAEGVVENAYETAAPSVVHITSTVLTRDFFFRIVPSQGTGSGIVISNDGLIVTNNHVIQDANKIEVKLSNGDSYRAQLLGASPSQDIALLKINAKDLPVATLGDSDKLKIGMLVIAIGNPFGLDRTATTGIISALNRSIESGDGVMEDLIQTDASINPGNSGGPLVNSKGEVIGINTAIFSTSGGSIGIGFAIPINKVKGIVKGIQEGKAEEAGGAWLGVTATTVTPELAETLNLPVSEGAMLVEVVPESPAGKAGLRGGSVEIILNGVSYTVGGDIITAIDGKPIRSVEELVKEVKSRQPGAEISVKYVRKGEGKEAKIPLESR